MHCAGEEKEGQPSCTVGAGEDAAVVVSCNEGYMLKVLRHSVS